MPSASGLSNFVRITAGAVGTSLFTTLWEHRAAMHHAHLAESMNSSNTAAIAATAHVAAAGMSPEQAAATLSRLLDQQAYTMAVTDVFWLSSVPFVALIGVVWLTQPKPSSSAEVDAGGWH